MLLIETVDLHQVAAAYRRLYPLFQSAYEDLGYPGLYFNDRLIEVLDRLLATPDVSGPLKVHLPTINGPTPPPRPWVLLQTLEGLGKADAADQGNEVRGRDQKAHEQCFK